MGPVSFSPQTCINFTQGHLTDFNLWGTGRLPISAWWLPLEAICTAFSNSSLLGKLAMPSPNDLLLLVGEDTSLRIGLLLVFYHFLDKMKISLQIIQTILLITPKFVKINTKLIFSFNLFQIFVRWSIIHHYRWLWNQKINNNSYYAHH